MKHGKLLIRTLLLTVFLINIAAPVLHTVIVGINGIQTMSPIRKILQFRVLGQVL